MKVQVSGVRVQGPEFRFYGSGFRVQGSGLRVQNLNFRSQVSAFRFQGWGSRVQGMRCRFQGVHRPKSAKASRREMSIPRSCHPTKALSSTDIGQYQCGCHAFHVMEARASQPCEKPACLILKPILACKAELKSAKASRREMCPGPVTQFSI